MEKQIIYCEIAYANTIACFYVKNTQDYKNKLEQLKENYDNVQVMFLEWDDGTMEYGNLEGMI